MQLIPSLKAYSDALLIEGKQELEDALGSLGKNIKAAHQIMVQSGVTINNKVLVMEWENSSQLKAQLVETLEQLEKGKFVGEIYGEQGQSKPYKEIVENFAKTGKMSTSLSFSGTKSFKEAVDLLDTALEYPRQELGDRLTQELHTSFGPEQQQILRLETEGLFFDIAEVIRDTPEQWWNQEGQLAMKQTIPIFVQVNASGYTSVQDYVTFASIANTVIATLQEYGKTVEVTALRNNTVTIYKAKGHDTLTTIMALPIKKAEEPYSEVLMSQLVGAPYLQRRFFFSAISEIKDYGKQIESAGFGTTVGIYPCGGSYGLWMGGPQAIADSGVESYIESLVRAMAEYKEAISESVANTV